MHNNIFDSTATRAVNVHTAGMMAGMTSPARPWFRLGVPDKDLMKFHSVKGWLKAVEDVLNRIFSSSNTYNTLHMLYEELALFGTAGSIIAEDFENVIHHYPLTAGEFCVALDEKNQPCTLYRRYVRTVAQVIKRFGEKNVSKATLEAYRQGHLDKEVHIINAIEPRDERDYGKRDALNAPWASVYFEEYSCGNREQDKEYHFLMESGYDRFVCIVPRWSVRGNQVYGESPGMVALGDVKQLQQEQLRKGEAIDVMTRPPLQIPVSLKTQEVDRFPGGMNYVDGLGAGNSVKTMFEVNLRLDYLLEDIQDVRERINSSFYVDLFMMISSMPQDRKTATEIAELHEEKMLVLGHVLERLHNEMLDPLIDITFMRAIQAGIIPPAPQELQGVELKVEYISVLAQAQKAVSTTSIDRFVGNLGAIAQFKPDVLDKFDSDTWCDLYADKLGVDPQLIVPSKQVAIIRQQRAQQQQAMMQSEMMNQQADSMQKLGSVNTQEDNAASDLMRGLTGYTT